MQFSFLEPIAGTWVPHAIPVSLGDSSTPVVDSSKHSASVQSQMWAVVSLRLSCSGLSLKALKAA